MRVWRIFLILSLAIAGYTGCMTMEQGATRKVPDLPEDRLETVSASLLVGDPEKAISAYEKAFQNAPETATTKILYARLLLLTLRIDEAATEIGDVLRSDPKNTDALFAQALVYALKGDQQQQQSTLENLLALDPGYSEALAALGSLFLEQKNVKKAKELFLKAYEHDQQNLVALIGLGNVSYKEKNLNEAKLYFDRAIDLQPDYSFTYSDRALVKRRLDDLDGALQDLSTAVKLEPDYAYNYYDRGRIYLDKGKWDEAIQEFNRAIERDPEMFIAYVMRAGLYDERGTIDAATADFEKVIELRPNYFYAYSSLGTLYFMRNRFEDAFTMFDRAFRAQREMSEYGLLAALSLKKAKKAEGAVTYMNTILSFFPKKTWYYEIALFYITPSSDFNAVTTASQEKNHNRRAKMLFYLGEQYLVLNKIAQAKVFLNEAAEMEGKGMIEKRLAQHELEK